MAGRYRVYPEYKPSGNEWSGDIPASWRANRFKNIFSIKKRIAGKLGFDILSITQRGMKVKDIVSGDGQLAMDYSKYQLVFKGDFAMNHMDLITGYVDVSKFDGVTSPDYRVFSLDEGCGDPRYFLYILQHCYNAKIFFPLGQGAAHVGRWRLPAEAFNEFVTPVPTIEEQSQIAAFLDHETAQIDALIAKQQRLIELLEEKRQAVISHAVTKGLNPDAPLRPSGIDWLGDVPEHWEVVQARRIIEKMEQGKSPECHSFPALTDQWGVLKSGCVNGGHFAEHENKALPENIRPMAQYEVKPGDVLMSRASGSVDLIGSVAYILATRQKLLLSDKTFRIILAECSDAQFFARQMSARYVRELIKQSISGAEGMANNITKASIFSFPLTLPPLAEQREIVTFLTHEATKFNTLVRKAQSAINLLKERRTALISAAVTGKINVRDWQPPKSTSDTAPDISKDAFA